MLSKALAAVAGQSARSGAAEHSIRAAAPRGSAREGRVSPSPAVVGWVRRARVGRCNLARAAPEKAIHLRSRLERSTHLRQTERTLFRDRATVGVRLTCMSAISVLHRREAGHLPGERARVDAGITLRSLVQAWPVAGEDEPIRLLLPEQAAMVTSVTIETDNPRGTKATFLRQGSQGKTKTRTHGGAVRKRHALEGRARCLTARYSCSTASDVDARSRR